MRERFNKPVAGTAGTLVAIILIGIVIWLALRARPAPPLEPTTVAPAAGRATGSRPEATDEPSATPPPTPTPSVTPSPLPSETAAPPATPEPEPTPDGPATVMAIAAPTRKATSVSPDGRWQSELIVYPCSELSDGGDVLSFEQLNVVDIDSGEVETAAEQLINCGGLGAFGLEGLFWSANSRYFYFTTAREGVPDGCGYWRPPLLRFAVETAETQWLGPGAPSPDGAKIAAWQERELVIWETGGEEIGRIPAAIQDADLGAIAWSPAGDALVYLQAPSYCPLEKSYVVHLTIADMESAILLEAEDPPIGGVSWIDGGRLRLVDGDGEAWIYDLASDVLSPAP